MRIQIKFAKTRAMQYTGHLDLHRALERTIRRAGLPLAYSQGFHPHPKITLAAALPLGFTGIAEWVEFWLDEELPLSEIEERFRKASPPGIQMQELQVVLDKQDKLQNRAIEAKYVVTILEPIADLENKLDALLKAETLEIRKEKKRKIQIMDLRPLILEMAFLPAEDDGEQAILMHLLAQPGATGRPDDVLKVLDIPIEDVRVERTEILFRPNG